MEDLICSQSHFSKSVCSVLTQKISLEWLVVKQNMAGDNFISFFSGEWERGTLSLWEVKKAQEKSLEILIFGFDFWICSFVEL